MCSESLRLTPKMEMAQNKREKQMKSSSKRRLPKLSCFAACARQRRCLRHAARPLLFSQPTYPHAKISASHSAYLHVFFQAVLRRNLRTQATRQICRWPRRRAAGCGRGAGCAGVPQPSAAGSLGGGARPAPGACREPPLAGQPGRARQGLAWPRTPSPGRAGRARGAVGCYGGGRCRRMQDWGTVRGRWES